MSGIHISLVAGDSHWPHLTAVLYNRLPYQQHGTRSRTYGFHVGWSMEHDTRGLTLYWRYRHVRLFMRTSQELYGVEATLRDLRKRMFCRRL